MAMNTSEVVCDFLGSGRSWEVNPGRTWESREKRGHHDVPAGSEECPDSGRHPTPLEVCRGRRRAHQPPRYHQSPEIRCPFHNKWGNFPKYICKIHKRKKSTPKHESNANTLEVILSCPSPPQTKLSISVSCLEITFR